MQYLAYCRKSSESEERQALSIDAQKFEVAKRAEQDSVQITETYCESMSAKAPGRPVFKQMMDYIEKNGPCILYVWKLDRLTRNAKDGGEISYFMDKGLITEIRTNDKTIHNTSDDKFFLTLDFGMAKKFVDDLSVNVKRGNQEKLRQGGWPGTAPLGYLNDKADHTIVLDPLRAHYVEQMFKLYSTGTYGLKDIERILYEQGLRSKKGYRVHHSLIHRILSNPFYMGILRRHGKYYKGKHQPIIGKELFDKVDRAINHRQHTHNQKHMFVHRGFLRCDDCACQLTATTKKGYIYYYCTNGKKNCTQHKKYLREEKLDELISTTLEQLHIDEELIHIAHDASKAINGISEKQQQLSSDQASQQLQNIAQRREKLLDSYLSELIPEDVYKAKMQALSNEQVLLEQQKQSLLSSNDSNRDITLERVKEVLLIGNRAKKEFLQSKKEDRRYLLELLLWNATISDGNVASVSFKKPFDVVAKAPKNGDFAEMQAL